MKISFDGEDSIVLGILFATEVNYRPMCISQILTPKPKYGCIGAFRMSGENDHENFFNRFHGF